MVGNAFGISLYGHHNSNSLDQAWPHWIPFDRLSLVFIAGFTGVESGNCIPTSVEFHRRFFLCGNFIAAVFSMRQTAAWTILWATCYFPSVDFAESKTNTFIFFLVYLHSLEAYAVTFLFQASERSINRDCAFNAVSAVSDRTRRTHACEIRVV